MTLMPLPAVEPTVCFVDSSPLIHLAMIGALDLPLRFGPVVYARPAKALCRGDRDLAFNYQVIKGGST